MAFDNPSNHARAAKIVDALQLVARSAQSNAAEVGEVAAILAPVLDQLAVMGVLDAPAPAPQRSKTSAPAWATVHDMAREAPLPDLMRAVAVCLDRMDAALHSSGETG